MVTFVASSTSSKNIIEMNKFLIIILLVLIAFGGNAQNLKLKNQEFELHNVTGGVVKFQGKKVLKIERDLNALPFDSIRIEATVDEPHYARLVGLDDFENGTIEVKMYSQLQNPAPYSGIAGFIGLYLRIQEDD